MVWIGRDLTDHLSGWAGIPSTEQSITKDNLEKSNLAYTQIRYQCKSLECVDSFTDAVDP